MDVTWPISQSHFSRILFMLIKIKLIYYYSSYIIYIMKSTSI